MDPLWHTSLLCLLHPSLLYMVAYMQSRAASTPCLNPHTHLAHYKSIVFPCIPQLHLPVKVGRCPDMFDKKRLHNVTRMHIDCDQRSQRAACQGRQLATHKTGEVRELAHIGLRMWIHQASGSDNTVNAKHAKVD